jgi:hypothetical protein
MDTERVPKVEPWRPRPGELIARQTGGRYERIRAQAKRRRFVANAIVVSSTVAVLALAAVFNLLLSR